MKNFSRWKLYPGALIMPIRFILLAIPCFVIGFLCSFTATFLHDFKKGPLKRGPFKTFLELTFSWLSWISLLFGGIIYRRVDKDCDYTEYLGPNYKKEYKNITTSTIVSNHVTWVDGLVVLQYGAFAPVSAADNKRFPVIGAVCNVLNAVFVERGASKEKREETVQIIVDRQE